MVYDVCKMGRSFKAKYLSFKTKYSSFKTQYLPFIANYYCFKGKYDMNMKTEFAFNDKFSFF